MADYSTLKADIAASIYNNGQNLITGSVLQNTLLEMVDDINAGTQEDIHSDTTENYRKVNLDEVELRNGTINSSGNWNNTARYRHIVVPVTDYEVVEITTNASYGTMVAFLYEAGTPANGAPAPLVPGTSTQTIAAGTSVKLTAPKGTAYVFILEGDIQQGSSHARDFQPLALTAYYGMLSQEAVLDEESSRISALEVPVVSVKTSFTGAGGTFALSERVYNFAPGQAYRMAIFRPDCPLDDTSGSASRLTLRAYYADGTSIILASYTTAQTLPDYIDFVAPANVDNIRVGGRASAGEVFPVAYFPIAGGSDASGDILSLNPDSEWVPKMLSAKKRYYTSTYTTAPVPVVLAHISDIHANWINVERFLRWCGHHSQRIDALVNSGDTVSDTYTDGVVGYNAIEGVDKIMNVVGNHDTRGTGSNWQQYIGVPAYNMLIAPYVAGWNVVQPANAATNGYCYYYKDYAEQSLRIIFVDIMGFDAAQASWLAGVLADALTLNYHTLIVTHFAGGRTAGEASNPSYQKEDCNYSSMYSLGGDSTQLNGYNANAYLLSDTVATYMSNGGIFCGYIQGHYHRDFVAKLDKYPAQMVYSVGSDKAGELRDFNHIVGTRMQDEFQIVSIDTYQSIVKLYKVGANVDVFGRHINSVCVKYQTGEIYAQGF